MSEHLVPILAALQEQEPHRLACEARWLLELPTAEDRRRYLALVKEKRGEEAHAALRQAASDLWQADNQAREGQNPAPGDDPPGCPAHP